MKIPPSLAERSEAEALFDFGAGAALSTRFELGIATEHLAGGVLLSVRADPYEFWSKAVGFGFDEPVTGELVAQICDFYRSQRAPVANLQIAPSELPPDWDEICARENLTPGPTIAKMVADVDEISAAEPGKALDPGLRLTEVRREAAQRWAAVMLDVFGMPHAGLTDVIASSVGRTGWHAFAVWDGEDIVATAMVRTHRDAAQFFGAATAPSMRGRGAQSALLAARAKVARAAGCRWLVAETGAEAPGNHNTSLHNMLRLGFEVLYERPTWVWRPAPDHG